MGVDVAHLLRGHAAVPQGHGHGPGAAAAVGQGGGHVVGVTGGAVAHDLSVDGRVPLLSVLQLLQQQNAGALAHDEAVPLSVKGNGGPAGVL